MARKKATEKLRLANLKRERQHARGWGDGAIARVVRAETCGNTKKRNKRQGCPSRGKVWKVKPQTSAVMGRADYGDLLPHKHGGVIVDRPESAGSYDSFDRESRPQHWTPTDGGWGPTRQG